MYKALIEKKNAAKRKTGVKFGSFSSEGGKGKMNWRPKVCRLKQVYLLPFQSLT